MTAVEMSQFGGLRASARSTARRAASRERWSLAPSGGTAEIQPRKRRGWSLRSRAGVQRLDLTSGALTIADPVHRSVGELSVSIDKTRSARLTIADVISLGNRLIAVDLVVSPLGADAGPDEPARLEGSADRTRDGALHVTLVGDAPAVLGGADTRLKVTAVFERLR
jgi:hypothetical protein